MVTLVAGQLILQRSNNRIWRITGPAPRRITHETRWRIALVTPSPEYDDRMPGEYTDCSDVWLNQHCEDYPNAVDPPCGDGVQVVRICLPNRRVVVEQQFTRAAEAVAYCATQLASRRDDHAEWFGWLIEADESDLPDMVARLNDESNLVWAEVVHGVS